MKMRLIKPVKHDLSSCSLVSTPVPPISKSEILSVNIQIAECYQMPVSGSGSIPSKIVCTFVPLATGTSEIQDIFDFTLFVSIATTTSKCEVSGNGEHHTTSEKVDAMSDSNVDSEPAIKSRTANSFEERCSPDSVFGVTNDDVATDEVARSSSGTPADEASIGQSSTLNGERDKHREKNGVLSGNNISPQTKGDGTAVSHSILEMEDSDDEMQTTKKR